MKDKYTKVVYQSNPIGKDRIVLYLTTFDLEAFEKDENLEKIPEREDVIGFQFNKEDFLNNPNFIEDMENKFETLFKEIYEQQLLDMKSYIEHNRKVPKAQWYEIESEKER